MAHKTLVNGTAYDITGGKTLVSGTAYSIKGGRTLVGGTGYDVSFAPPELILYDSYDSNFGSDVLEGTIRFRTFRQDKNGNESWLDESSYSINKIARIPGDAIANAITQKSSYNAIRGSYFPVAWIGPIDFTKYSELHISAKRENVDRSSSIDYGCSLDATDNLVFESYATIESHVFDTDSFKATTLNISSVSGQGFVKLVNRTGASGSLAGSGGEEIYCNKIWLT